MLPLPTISFDKAVCAGVELHCGTHELAHLIGP
jgi:hypothetical protein